MTRYDGVADLAAGPEGKPLRHGRLLARLGLIRHAQVGAQHIDEGLPVRLASHRPGPPWRGPRPAGQLAGLIPEKLGGDRGEPLVQRPGALLRERSVQLLALCRERVCPAARSVP